MGLFLETKRLKIMTPVLTDFADLYALQADCDVMQYIGKGVRTREEVKVGLEKAIRHYEKFGFSLGSVYEKTSDQFVGRAGLIHLGYDEEQSDIEVAYAFVKSAWGKGYGIEVTKALINWGFKHLALQRLVAVTHPENTYSRNVLEKSSMHYIGMAHYGHHDVVLYEILKSSLHDIEGI